MVLLLPVCIIQAVAFVDLLAVGLMVPVLMTHVRRIGGSHLHIGLLASLYAGFQFGSGPLIGSLSDITGRKFILITTLLMSSVAYTIMGFTSSIYIILTLRAVLGLFKQTQMLTKAMVQDYVSSKEKQGEIYGKMMAVSGVGMTLGPVVGGHMAEDCPDCGFSLVAITVGFCFFLNAGLIFLLPRPTARRPTRMVSSTESPAHHSKNIFIMLFSSLKQSLLDLNKIKWSQYGDIFMFEGLSSFAMGIYYAIYGAFLKERYNLTPKYVGSIISFQRVIGSLSSVFIGYINCLYTCDKDYSERNFHVFSLLTIALIGLIFSVNVYLFTFWLIPLSIGNAIGRLITLEMVLNRSCIVNSENLIGASDSESEKSISVVVTPAQENNTAHRGKLIGVTNSIKSLCGIVSPMVAGIIGQWLGVGYVIYASLLATTLGLILSYQLKRKTKI